MKAPQLLAIIVGGLCILGVPEVFGVCLGVYPSSCLVNMEESEVNETLQYVLEKYAAADMEIPAEPLELRGQRITSGDTEEVHLIFKYGDKTPADVIQNCAFILTTRPGECQLIRTVCNAFVANTPRPLLRPKSLVVCGGGGGEGEEEGKVRVVDLEEEQGEEEDGEEDAAQMPGDDAQGEGKEEGNDSDVEILKDTTTVTTPTKA